MKTIQNESNELFEQNIKTLGEDIFNSISKSSPSLFNKDWWYGRIMEWSMKNDKFKTQMFRFVDVLPYLQSSSEVSKHLKEYFIEEEGSELPAVFNMGMGMGSLAPGLMSKAIKKNVQQMAKMFITGESPNEALPVLVKSRKNNLGFTIDLLGEITLSETEAQDYHKRYTELLEFFVKESKKWKPNPLLDTDSLGEIPVTNISVKLTSLYSQINEKNWQGTIDILKERLRPIFLKAKQSNVFVNIDMESYHHKDITIETFKQILSEEEFVDYPHWGIVIQAYLRDSYKDLEKLTHFAKERKTPFSIRLVKGAYWDYEVILAKQKGWPIPVYTIKKESDANYEKCLKLLLDNYPHIKLAIGSHNIRSISTGIAYAEKIGLPKNAFEIQMLYGMADGFKKSLVEKGFRIREYATVGELIPGMAYLVRRLLENTSNESFLRSKFADNVSTDKLLSDPSLNLNPSSEKSIDENHFYNEPLLDFTQQTHRDLTLEALERFKEKMGQECPLVIGGQKKSAGQFIEHYNPSHNSQLVTKVGNASVEDAELALQSAREAWQTWKHVDAQKRADIIDKVAELMIKKRYDLIATIVVEAGKPWSEADGDVTEAIDFCRYYARHMRELVAPKRIGNIPGEVSLYTYKPKGVSLVISPWNFPLAILTGMVSASLVTGNTVIMKPAEQTTAIAYELMKILEEAGVPPGAVNFLSGRGEEVGEYLTGHKDVDLICFTGSKEVGLHIYSKAAQYDPGQRTVKKCIIEMGGKNALIVDSDADLDEAISGLLYSAFGFSGQKCSAASRAIVLEENYDRFVERFVEATRSINVSYAENPVSYMGPVIDQQACEKIHGMIDRAKENSSMAFQGEAPSEGCFVPPTVFINVDPQSEIAQQEVFGPVLAIIKAKNIEEAIQIANGVEFGLTAGLYSRSPGNIAYFKENIEAGNIYINRSITGAMVNRHPFGGVKMSGIGSKTGGPDYLLNFVDPICFTENTMRRGFAPSEEA
ncbi:MAG: proline dehydrogenase family protein [Bdellovibrionales bacterium]|nr:proline dehydrogenase family protein [Bdellovibrionales bacterium]